jgi:hypothetical protein
VQNGQQQEAVVTDLEHWFFAFARTRNAILHDGAAPQMTYDEPGSAYGGPMLWTAERVLREAIRVALGRFGYDQLWQPLFTRRLRQKLREDTSQAAHQG